MNVTNTQASALLFNLCVIAVSALFFQQLFASAGALMSHGTSMNHVTRIME